MATTSQPAPRILYLDALRNCLMLLGVVLHAAQPFTVNLGGLVRLQPARLAFDYLISAIHLFRLPAFFLIAGYVGSFVIRSRGIQFFVRRRIVRLGVPFLVALFILNSLDSLAEAAIVGQFRDGFSWHTGAAWVLHEFGRGNLKHLWFLPTLFLYSVVVIPLLRAMWNSVPGAAASRLTFSLLERIERAEFLLPVLAFSLILADTLSWRLIGLWRIVRWTQIPSPDLLLHYLPFFLFGILAERRPILWSRFGNTVAWYTLANAGMIAAVLLSFSPIPRVAAYSLLLLDSLAAWTLIGLLIRLGRKFLDRPAPAIISSPDIAYSVYLVHHIVITALALLFIPFHTSATLQFLSLTLFAGGISIAFAQAIRHSAVLRFAFNGRLPA